MKRNSKGKLISLIAVVCVFLIGGTIAYFSDQETKANTLTMGKFNSDLHEEFDPPSDWKPGVEVEKKVRVDNTGTVDMIVAARFDESCVRREDVYLKRYNNETKELEDILVANAGEKLPVIFDIQQQDGQIVSYKEVAVKNFGADVTEYIEGSDPSAYEGKWVYTYDVKNGVYYFLYMGIVEAGKSSPQLLDSVTMNSRLENVVSNTEQVYWYDEETGENKQSFTYQNSEYGYDAVDYKLDITAKTLQASKKAIQSEWSTDTGIIPDNFKELLTHLEDMCGK